jgi:hypothetical protein
MKKFLIFSPSYNELSGGIIVLHKLCHLINQSGREAYITPYFHTVELNRLTKLRTLVRFVKNRARPAALGFRTNPHFEAPLLTNLEDVDDFNNWIVIYPEVVFGNPLNATNIVRWLLHNPGFHTGRIYYGQNELYFKFNGAIKTFCFPGSTMSKNELKVVHYPLEYYNADGVATERQGTAYTLRKGVNKKIQHDLLDSILIDGKSHAEVANIFKKVKTFISYDVYTAYSIFAVLCGCDSVVIPDEGVDEKSWYPNPEDKFGLAYGFENIANSRLTRHLVFERVSSEEAKSLARVQAFVDEVEDFFAT